MAGLFLLALFLNESNVTSFQAWNEVAANSENVKLKISGR